MINAEFKLKRIEIRTPIDYSSSRKKVQFYINEPFKVLLTLKQTDHDKDEVFVYGTDLLGENGSNKDDEIHIYIVGITRDDEIFIFEPYQDLIPVVAGMALRFKNVKKVRNHDYANRISSNS